jgi:bifunctional NMN adenylyltransferase/nudix hydrolase
MVDKYDLAVYIGRFQPFHDGHLALLQKGLSTAPRVVVVLGSSYQARTPRNPFTWRERADMILQALPESERERVAFLPIRDYYDESRWVRAVIKGVQAIAGSDAASIGLIGYFKDATSAYLRNFRTWTLRPQDRQSPVDAAHLRDAIFGGEDNSEASLTVIGEHVPPGVLAYLRAWTALPFLRPLCDEWAMLRDYRKSWERAPYPPIFVTVDSLVTCSDRVLLVERAHAPGKGLLALPGGFVEQRETLYQSALRELQEETHLGVLESMLAQSLKSVAVFDHPDRSLRGRTITHTHHFDLGARDLPEIKPDDDARDATWIPIAALPDLEDRFLDDHFHMLDHFLGLTTD